MPHPPPREAQGREDVGLAEQLGVAEARNGVPQDTKWKWGALLIGKVAHVRKPPWTMPQGNHFENNTVERICLALAFVTSQLPGP